MSMETKKKIERKSPRQYERMLYSMSPAESGRVDRWMDANVGGYHHRHAGCMHHREYHQHSA